jgi:hypothetical protein
LFWKTTGPKVNDETPWRGGRCVVVDLVEDMLRGYGVVIPADCFVSRWDRERRVFLRFGLANAHCLRLMERCRVSRKSRENVRQW